MPKIETRIEAARGCGYRKPGGIYLVGPKAFASCGRLTIPLTVCPCCSAGIKPTRGWTWVAPELVIKGKCALEHTGVCAGCAWTQQPKLGLIWVGESFYRTPAEFIAEANMAGVSRRIANVPRDFKVGETWVMLAHRKAINQWKNGSHVSTPGVFAVFRPSALEYIVTGEESPGRLDDLAKRGFTLVKVIPDNKTQMKLDDQLQPFSVKYSTTVGGVESHKIFHLQALSKTKAREQFKRSFPNTKIISVK